MPRGSAPLPPRTRIQARNTAAILEAALDVFAAQGYAGATLDAIARRAGLSKPNLLYYFAGKEAVYVAVLAGVMDDWLEPLAMIDPDGEPVDQIIGYVLTKLDMSRRFPRESRLFANEILSGAPMFLDKIRGDLRAMVEEKAALLERWQREGRLARLEARHLLFSIWATTQHYADFDVQVRGILRPQGHEHYAEARTFLEAFYRGALSP